MVNTLGERFPIPVEVYPSSCHYVEDSLINIGATEVELRLAKAKDGPVITETGNLILDVRFSHIGAELEKEIKSICGVIESGLFMGYNVQVHVAEDKC
jgi:ribose 5-phosphate isomerase A